MRTPGHQDSLASLVRANNRTSPPALGDLRPDAGAWGHGHDMHDHASGRNQESILGVITTVKAIIPSGMETQ